MTDVRLNVAPIRYSLRNGGRIRVLAPENVGYAAAALMLARGVPLSSMAGRALAIIAALEECPPLPEQERQEYPHARRNTLRLLTEWDRNARTLRYGAAVMESLEYSYRRLWWTEHAAEQLPAAA